MLTEGLWKGRGEKLMTAGLALVSILAVFSLYAVSDLLHLRALATPSEKLVGSLIWLFASVLLIGLPLYGGCETRTALAAWVTLVPWALLAYAAIQVSEVFGLLPPLLPGIPDLALDVAALLGGMWGVYSSATGAAEAVRSHHPIRAVLSLPLALIAASVVILWIWVCLYFE